MSDNNFKYLRKFSEAKCPSCKSSKIVMKLQDINIFQCKKCGKKFTVKYDD